MLFEKLAEARKKHNVLSQCDVLGSFDFFSTIVSLDSLDTSSFENLETAREQLRDVLSSSGNIELDNCQKLRSVQPLALHEYTHFIDSTSTLWGMKYLNLMAKAYEADDRRFGGREDSFFQAKQFSDFLRFIKLPSYFTYKPATKDISPPWTFRESIGNRFDNSGQVSTHPVLFTQFGNNKNQLVVRSPVSTLSILECSAMSQEVGCHIGLIMGLEDGVRDVEMGLYTEELLNYIYDRDLTEYSVCAHLLANSQANPDIALAYKGCGIICRYVLNTPSIIYQHLSENVDFSRIFGAGSGEWNLKIKKGLELNEPGFLFYLICKLIPQNAIESKESLMAGLKKAFDFLDVDIDYLKSEAKKEFEALLAEVNESKLDNIVKISNSGYNNFLKINWDVSSLPFDTLDLPPVLLGDSSSIQIFPGVDEGLKNFDLEILFDDMFEGQSWVERFTEACA